MARSSDLTRRKVIRFAIASAAAATTGARAQSQGDSTRERVEGIGGFFFRARDPRALAAWYQTHLGIATTPTGKDSKPWRQSAGTTAFTPFREDTSYFGDKRLPWMINFRVRDLAKMVAQLRENGIAVTIESETDPSGKFARLNDPEGNPIQLWQPAGKDPG